MSKATQIKNFLEVQNYKIKLNITFQDNESAIKLTKNKKDSSGERTRHFNIRLFHATNVIGHRGMTVEHCLTNKMIADYALKLLVRQKFKTF